MSILGGGLTGVKDRTVPLAAIQRANYPVFAPGSFEILAADSIDKLMAKEKHHSHRSRQMPFCVRGELPIPFVVSRVIPFVVSSLSRSW